MADTDYYEVVVKEAARDDAGRGIARLSIEVMRALGIVSGDVIEIQGKRKATAIVWPGFAQSPPPPPSEVEENDLKAPEPIEKTEEAREQEKIKKFEQTQYELDEMGMTLEERKMRRVRPEKP